MTGKPKDPKDVPPADLDDITDHDDAEGFGGDTGFDYAAFEESLDEIDEVEDLATDPGMPDETVVERPTVDILHAPKTDATVETRQLGDYTVVAVRGRVNEGFDGKNTGSKLRGNVLFDLTEVDRITSFGVRSWLQMLDAARMDEAVFFRASPAVVNQITMMRNFCGPARIHSLVAPYSCKTCGAEFGVVLDALDDRQVLQSRKPPKTACPQCQGASELDEDPWVFFALDDQLLDEKSIHLQHVIDEIASTTTRVPVEKSILGSTTHIRFNGRVTRETRFQRAFTGLEGEAVLDFRTATGIDPAAVDELVSRLARLGEDVTALWVEGATVALTERLLENPDDRIVVRWVTAHVRSLARPLERDVVFDLKRERRALDAGELPDIDVAWRDDRIEVEGLETLQAAAAQLERATEPVPIMPAAQPAASNSPPPQASGSSRAPLAIAGAGVAVAVLLLLAVAVGSGALQTASTVDGTAQVDPNEPSPKPAPAPTGPGVWSTGGSLPPTWSEVPLVEKDGQLLLTGQGTGDSVASAVQQARSRAASALIERLSTTIDVVFEDEALPETGPTQDQLLRFSASMGELDLQRVEDASMEDDSGLHVVVQYGIDTAAIDSFVDRYSARTEFRGLDLVESAPWAEPGVRLAERASYVPLVRPGDRLVSVGEESVDTLEDFDEAAERALAGIEEGATLPLTFERDGERITTTVAGIRAAPRPTPATRPANPDRPTLFRKDL